MANDRSLLFDPKHSGLPLLDMSKADLMKAIYSEVASRWIKVTVVRDPVTRLLSAYLDLVRIREANRNRERRLLPRRGRRRRPRQGEGRSFPSRAGGEQGTDRLGPSGTVCGGGRLPLEPLTPESLTASPLSPPSTTDQVPR